MIVSARGQTRSRTARLLPSVTQRSPAIAALVRSRSTESGAVLKSGPKYSESSSTCGTPSAAASSRASVVLPDPVRPSTAIAGGAVAVVCCLVVLLPGGAPSVSRTARAPCGAHHTPPARYDHVLWI